MENMDKEPTVPKWAENIPNAPKNFGPICLPKPKSLDFQKKLSLGVRSPWGSVLMPVSNLICIIYYFPTDSKFYDVLNALKRRGGAQLCVFVWTLFSYSVKASKVAFFLFQLQLFSTMQRLNN